MHSIDVPLADAAAFGVKGVVDHAGLQHRHVVRQLRSQGQHHFLRAHPRCERRRHQLPSRVDARVGTAGGSGEHGFSGEACEGLFQHALHRAGLGLLLPSTEASAVVSDDETPC